IDAEELLHVHTAWLAFSAGARTDHEIVPILKNRIDQPWYKFGAIAAITVQEHDHITFRRDRSGPGRARAAIPARSSDDARARCAGSFGRLVAAAVIHHDHFSGDSARDYLLDADADRLLFV